MGRTEIRCWFNIVLIGLVLLAGMACSKKTFIYVDYRLPPISESLYGRTVFVESNDLRSSEEIFNPRAKKSFESFTGLFSLSLIKPDNEQTMIGAYNLPMLFKTALQERLKSLGVNIAEQQSPNTPVFKIDINQFNINLIGQKWIADIGYEVSLTQDNQTISRETVAGSAEQVKIVGSGGAEKIMGEIFTEMINRLNIKRLFQQANL